MSQSLANFSEALKEVYAPGLRNAINNSSVTWSEAVTNTEDIIGEEAVWSVHAGRSGSTGARAELAALPVADRQRFIKPRRGLTYQYHTIKVSGQAKNLTQSNSGAFAKALDKEVKGAEKDLKRDMCRQVFGQYVTVNGAATTGVIATLSADPGVTNTLTFANEPESVIRHFHVGMLIDATDPATGTVRAGGPYEVLAVNKDARTVTISPVANAAIASGDVVHRQGSLGQEIDGLRALIDSTTPYAGIDPATQSNWASIEVGAPSAISEVLIDELQEAVETDGDGSTPELLICEHVQRRKLASQLQTQKRYDGRQVTLTSGWKGLDVARGVLVADRFCPSNDLFAIHKPELQKFIGLDFQWDDDDGEVLYKALDGSDAIEARFKGYVQLAATNRNSHGKAALLDPAF